MTRATVGGARASAETVRLASWALLRRHWVQIILSLLLLLAAVLRFYDSNYDQGIGAHPDEDYMSATVDLQLAWPPGTTLAQLFDPAHSSLNVRVNHQTGAAYQYRYGTLPLYLLRLLGSTVLSGQLGNGLFSGYPLLGRHLAAVFDLITILLVFLVGRRLFGKGAGVLAAAFSALAVTQIQIAHYFTTDTFLLTFLTATLYFSVVLMQDGRWWAAALAGLMLGFALACKVSAAPLGLLIVGALALRVIHHRGATAGLRVRLVRALPLLLLAAAFVALGLFTGDPYALLDSGIYVTSASQLPAADAVIFSLGDLRLVSQADKYFNQLGWEATIQNGTFDTPFTLQFIGRTPFLDNIQQLVTWGLGLTTGLVGVAGVLLAFYRAWRGRQAEILLLLGLVPYYVSIATLLTKWIRYMLPTVPYLCILGAALLVRGLAWSRRAGRQGNAGALLRRWAFPALTGLALLNSALWTTAFMNIYTHEHTHTQMSRWMLANIPPEAVIGFDDWDDHLPAGLPGYPPHDPDKYFRYTPFDYRSNADEFALIKSMLAQSDYISIASNKIRLVVPRLPWRYPLQTRYYQLLFDGKLGFEQVKTIRSYPQIFGIDIIDDYADDTFTSFDHPITTVLKKVRNLSDAELQSLFADALTQPSVNSRSLAQK